MQQVMLLPLQMQLIIKAGTKQTNILFKMHFGWVLEGILYWSVYLQNFDAVESKKVWTMQAKLSPKDVYHHLPSIDGIIPI